MSTINSGEERKGIYVYGARVHNLKNIDVFIPRDQLVVITGLSGSGKSSLAFDTIYAEGQRRYMETMSAYARQFIGTMERPDVDQITGLSPVIAIEQKTVNKNPRSTVGTVTEIYDFLRLMYARVAKAYSYVSGEEMVRFTEDQIIEIIVRSFSGKKCMLLSPLVKGRKGHYKELFETYRKKGYLYVRVDGEVKEMTSQMKLDRYKVHDIELVIDKLEVSDQDEKRLKDSVKTALLQGKGVMMVWEVSANSLRFFSKKLMCPTSGISYDEPAPHSFSFNSPHGACPRCNGLGMVNEMDIDKIIPDRKLSIKKGAIQPIGPFKNTLIFWQLEAIAAKYHFTINTPFDEIPEAALNIILNGSEETFKLKNSPLGENSNYLLSFDGIINYIVRQESAKDDKADAESNSFVKEVVCPECNGTRLKKESLYFKIADKNISELSVMDLSQLFNWFDQIEPQLDKKQKQIGNEVIKELKTRIRFLLDVGIDYLSLNRSSRSLSGGESQRIRLATQIGSQLVNVLYILDEPSIGLHQRDNTRLIAALKELRDRGNSVIVVEHDKEMILAADYVIDVGPKAGKMGGEIVAAGTPDEILSTCSLTAQYLNGQKKIDIPLQRRKGSGKSITITGAAGNNLKNLNVSFPLGKFICVTGVSGSGKSTLIYETLYPLLANYSYNSSYAVKKYDKIEGLENIDKVIEVDQSPLGRTPRSNPATYTGLFSDIRKLYELTPDAKIRGFGAGRFSFNIKGGRCETCKGAGVQTIEMNFLPDVYVTCPDCSGKRYNRETLEVKYKGSNINDVLEMTIRQAHDFFEHIPSMKKKLETFLQVGLGYVKLGQPSTTLSGGESQRVKLAAELSRKDTGKTFYILDEPTTGLHFEDVRILLEVLNNLVEKGNTVLVIEHNMDVIKVADHIIDIGPEGGIKGGCLIAEGTPEEVAKNKTSYTAAYLKAELNNKL